MIRLTVLILALMCYTVEIFPHYMWIETDHHGIRGVSHKVKLFYGEYSYNYIEKISEGFKDVNRFELWLISPDNKKMQLSCLPAEDHYYTQFTPETEGVYYVVMVNENIDVLDWREWNLGILKPGFYASASVVVGSINPGLQIPAVIPAASKFLLFNSSENKGSTNPVTLKIYYNNELQKGHELTAGFIEGWTKKMVTDSTGTAEFTAPWEGLYIIEAVYNDKTPGRFNGKEYETVRNVATYSIRLKR